VKIITPQTKANEAAERFKKMHFDGYRWSKDNRYLPVGAASYEAVYSQLVALGPAPNPADIARLVNPSWVEGEWCVACEGRKELVVELDPNIDGGPVNICRACAEKAYALFEGAGK
jgi:hypothetical protein